MTSFGLVQLKQVWKMLKKCAHGYEKKEQPHKWRIEYNGRTFPDLPLGKRKSKTPEIELGVVKKMVRHLQLDPDCVHKHLPQIPKSRPVNSTPQGMPKQSRKGGRSRK